MFKHYTICLSESRYKVISLIAFIAIVLPGIAAAVLSGNCIMWRVYLELADFSLDLSFYLYRHILIVTLIWLIFEAIFRHLYGFEKFDVGAVLVYLALIGGLIVIFKGLESATASWADLRALPYLNPVVLLPLVMLGINIIVGIILGLVLLVSFLCDLHSWRRYDRAEAAMWRESESFITFCRKHSQRSS